MNLFKLYKVLDRCTEFIMIDNKAKIINLVFYAKISGHFAKILTKDSPFPFLLPQLR